MKRHILVSVVVSSIVSVVLTILMMRLTMPAMVSAEDARIRAEEVALVGSDGGVRARLQTGPGRPTGLLVLGADGTTRRIAMLTDGAQGNNPAAVGFNLFSPDNKQLGRLGAGTVGEGRVSLQLFDANERPRVRLRVDENGSPSIELLSPEGNPVWIAP
jgi:hypothetical protein